MSAPAIKSSMPGVGGTPPTTGHSMLPMNMMAQKVVQSSETNAMKPMTGSGINYVTLQPPPQPVSLVQDLRPQVYPQATTTVSTTTYSATTTTGEKDVDSSADPQKQIPNGLEGTKPESEQVQASPTKTVDTVKSNVESNAAAPAVAQEPQQQAPVPQIQLPTASVPMQQPVQGQALQSQPQSQPATPPQVQQQPAPQPPNKEEKPAEITPVQTGNQTHTSPPATPQAKPEEKKVQPAVTSVPPPSQPPPTQPPQTQPTPTQSVPTQSVTTQPLSTSSTATTTTTSAAAVAPATPAPVAPPPAAPSANSSNAKEVAETSTNVCSVKVPTPHKTEEASTVKTAESHQQKPKPQICPAKPAAAATEHSAPQPAATTSPKAEPKVASSPSRANKRKLKEASESRAQSAENSSKSKRKRRRTEPFQSPLPEIAMIVKTLTKPSASKAQDDKLIAFYKNEFLAVRNTEGSFYICQAMQNMYKSSRRVRIRWLSQDKTNGEIYSPDFYDVTDFDCIITNLNLNKIDKNKYQLSKFELLRTENILKRSIDVEAGVSEKPSVTEEHPDGLDLSLYKDEAQLKKRKKSSNPSKKKIQRKRVKKSAEESSEESESNSEESDEDEAPLEKKKSSPAAKKRTSNKALAIAKSVAKGPSRAERALNRGAKTVESVNNVPAKTEKKVEPKKPLPKAQNNNGAGASRATKVRGNSQQPSESKSNSTRPKRGTPSTSVSSKSRGRA